MVDKFFDALNVHNYTHGIHKRKEFQMPYTTSTDRRLKVKLTHHLMLASFVSPSCNSQWLEEDFLSYLNDWEESVKDRVGFTKTQKSKIC